MDIRRLHSCRLCLSNSPPPFSALTFSFFFTATATTAIYTLSLHDALPISSSVMRGGRVASPRQRRAQPIRCRSEEHTSELQSRFDLVCRLLLEKKKSQHFEIIIYLSD